MHFKLKKCDIFIDYAFILVLSLVAVFNSSRLLYLLLFSFLHEIGHLSALLICKSEPYEMRLSYYGFAIRYEDNLPIIKECAVLLSGPMVNLILYLFFKDDINLILFLLNCLPVYPLDVGRIVRLFSLKASRILSIITIVLICILCVYMLIYNKSYSLIFVTVYLIIYSINYS
ncbi:MAG: hypothetical protein MR281_02365 [Eubacterium sp.]|nr:hypothetical protein [Eubacterium sp.]